MSSCFLQYGWRLRLHVDLADLRPSRSICWARIGFKAPGKAVELPSLVRSRLLGPGASQQVCVVTFYDGRRGSALSCAAVFTPSSMPYFVIIIKLLPIIKKKFPKPGRTQRAVVPGQGQGPLTVPSPSTKGNKSTRSSLLCQPHIAQAGSMGQSSHSSEIRITSFLWNRVNGSKTENFPSCAQLSSPRGGAETGRAPGPP